MRFHTWLGADGQSFQRLRAAFEVAIIPAVESPMGDADLVQRALGRQVRLLDDSDDLELLGRGIWSTPSRAHSR